MNEKNTKSILSIVLLFLLISITIILIGLAYINHQIEHNDNFIEVRNSDDYYNKIDIQLKDQNNITFYNISSTLNPKNFKNFNLSKDNILGSNNNRFLYLTGQVNSNHSFIQKIDTYYLYQIHMNIFASNLTLHLEYNNPWKYVGI